MTIKDIYDLLGGEWFSHITAEIISEGSERLQSCIESNLNTERYFREYNPKTGKYETLCDWVSVADSLADINDNLSKIANHLNPNTEIEYGYDEIKSYIREYTDRLNHETNENSISYDKGVLHGLNIAMIYFRRLKEDSVNE